MEFFMGSKKDQELITSPFSDCQIFSEAFSFCGPLPDDFWRLSSKAERDFGVFKETTIANLCKTFHDVMIIQFSTFSWSHKALGKKKKNLKNWNTWRKKIAF